jgi:RES domain-containing protein
LSARVIAHGHVPIFRVVRAGWADPLDTGGARKHGGRWNPPKSFPVLYACCSVAVARAVARERLDHAGVVLDDLGPQALPQLVELAWKGTVVDLASADGLASAGLPLDYPRGVGHDRTQPLGQAWHGARRAGVLCRSATLGRAGFSAWQGPHEPFSEAAIFTGNAPKPRLLRRRAGLDWLDAGASTAGR